MLYNTSDKNMLSGKNMSWQNLMEKNQRVFKILCPMLIEIENSDLELNKL